MIPIWVEQKDPIQQIGYYAMREQVWFDLLVVDCLHIEYLRKIETHVINCTV
jgi:hypothetical protein